MRTDRHGIFEWRQGARSAATSVAAGAVLALALGGCDPHSKLSPASSSCDLIVPATSRVSAPTWDSTGTRIAVFSSHDAAGDYAPGLYVANVLTGQAKRVADQAELGQTGWLEWSPVDDRLLAWRQRDIWVLDPATHAWSQVTDGTHVTEGPRWSPDGEWVYYTRWNNADEPVTSGGLWLTELHYQLSRQVVSVDGALVWPVGCISFAPTGDRFAYAAPVPGPDPGNALGYEIFVMRRDGSDRRQITFQGGEALDPVWLPDGSEIVFDFASAECLAAGAAARHTWGVRPDGTGLHQWPHDLHDPRIVDGLPPAFDRTGRLVAFPGVEPSLGVGALYVMNVSAHWKRPVFNW